MTCWAIVVTVTSPGPTATPITAAIFDQGKSHQIENPFKVNKVDPIMQLLVGSCFNHANIEANSIISIIYYNRIKHY